VLDPSISAARVPKWTPNVSSH